MKYIASDWYRDTGNLMTQGMGDTGSVADLVPEHQPIPDILERYLNFQVEDYETDEMLTLVEGLVLDHSYRLIVDLTQSPDARFSGAVLQDPIAKKFDEAAHHLSVSATHG